MDNALIQVVNQVDENGTLLHAWSLQGGVSAQTTALDIMGSDGVARRLVVRCHGERDLARNPYIARDEFRLLQQLHRSGLPVPLPYLFDQSGRILPTPYIVLAYVEGEPDFAPADLQSFLRQAANLLAAIHAVDCFHLNLDFLPRQTNALAIDAASPSQRERANLIQSGLESIALPVQVNRSTLLHGDYWPGNLLWKQGNLIAVIDWEDAMIGEPLVDVANGRLEILWSLGREAMADFTDYYRSIAAIDFKYLPYWDLNAALRSVSAIAQWGLDEKTVAAMWADHGWFVEQAMTELQRVKS